MAPDAAYEPADILGGLYGPGIIGLKGAFDRGFVQHLREDIDALFDEALRIPGGAVPRGPSRHYVEIHPERLRGFVELVTHPWIVAVCEAVLGPDWRLVEIGFDVPGPGAMDQPWHRDFPSPAATRIGRRLDSLAFNLTTVDVTEAMGPFEIAPGTQWDAGLDFDGGMFPPRAHWPRYEARAERKLPRMGDVSARSALTIHRGTANRSTQSRPVLVLGMDAPDAGNAERHDLQVTRGYAATLPPGVLAHMTCRVVDRLEPIVQLHQIEGLRMGLP
ncbi:phytanoyl-CoA dioxygenase family protein [Cognatilysobacter segetis]|uniref:phytanoyl-CoA dioxygenase family protein n=1 Tax=Cognatilysobacter segetis TaxID=2492394 RepID=UPI0010614E68|nr:phytanoyl-CoA dioxygenase family protein [Lysobacter segetis]